MRRITSTFFACLAAAALGADAGHAQTIGFKLGATSSTLSATDAAFSSGSITGFIGGGHIRFGLGGRIGLQAELLSVTRGGNLTGPGTASREVRFEYVEIPVLVHIPLTLGAFAPYLFGGPGIALEVRCRYTPAGGSSTDCTDNQPFDRSSTDFGLTAGGGIAIGMGPGAVLLEGRYTFGMSDVFTTPGARNRSGAIMAGYEIPLGRAW
jgi:hypothetical protein